MLTYKRVSNTNGIMRYEYYPDGDASAPGIVEIVANGIPKVIRESAKDFKMYYAYHAMYHIDITREKGTVAWY